MFNAGDIFAKQFEPFGDGYVFHSRLSGGRFVSKDEYDSLYARHRRVVPRSVFILMAGIIPTSMAQQFFDLPPTWLIGVTSLLVAVVIAMIFWISFAPSRLVRGRPVVAPPKTVGDMRRTARSMIPWPMVVVVIVLSAVILGGCLVNPQSTLAWWLWTMGASTMLVAYIWIAIGKMRDK